MSAIIGIAALGSFTFHYVSINTKPDTPVKTLGNVFTFHYVSINTGIVLRDFTGRFLSLHSTMFLLIQSRLRQILRGLSSFTFHYVSINTEMRYDDLASEFHFTFHYVSINTRSCESL